MTLLNRETRRFYGVPCGSWKCERCAVVKRRRFMRRVHLGLGADGATPAGRTTVVPRLLTLTCPPGEPIAASFAALTGRFQRLRQRVAARYGDRWGFEYAAVVELTRRGVPHLHVIFRGPYVIQAEWSRLAEAAGFGPVVDVRRVSSGGVASYAAKALGTYLSKGFGATFPSHFRRVRFSSGWAPSWVVRPARAASEAPGVWIVVWRPWEDLSGPLLALWKAWAWSEGGQGPPEAGGAERAGPLTVPVGRLPN